MVVRLTLATGEERWAVTKPGVRGFEAAKVAHKQKGELGKPELISIPVFVLFLGSLSAWLKPIRQCLHSLPL